MINVSYANERKMFQGRVRSVALVQTERLQQRRPRKDVMISQLLRWFFRNRATGDITIVQAPNLALWIVILAAVILWMWPLEGNLNAALAVVVKGALLFWAADEIIRGVNPWRRCLGAAVAAYEVATLI